MKKILGGIALSTLIAAPAMAADMPARMPVKAPAPAVQAFSWSGCYIGVNGGAVKNDTRIRTRGPFLAGASDGLLDALTIDRKFDDLGGTAGGTVGCNWQSGAWVFGIEGDGNWARIRETQTAAFAAVPAIGGTGFVDRTETVSHRLDWFATARGRLGFAAGNALVYGTGGAAFGRVRSDTTIDPAGVALYVGSGRDNSIGWTAGGGVEMAFGGNWSLKAEYLYVDLGRFTYNSPNVGAGTTAFWTTRVDTQFHVARVGLNWRFGGGPVVARY